MVRFWSCSGILVTRKGIIFSTVMESGTEERTIISAGKGAVMTDLVELNHVGRTVTVFSHDDENKDMEAIVKWAKQLYHEYFQPDDKVVHNEYGVGKIETFHKNDAYVNFNKVGKNRNVDYWVLTDNLTKMK